MVIFSNPNKTAKTSKPQKTPTINKTRSKKIPKNKTKSKLPKYTVTIAMIIHGCIITTDLNQINQNYNIDLNRYIILSKSII